MKNKIFRILIIAMAFVPGLLALNLFLLGLFEIASGPRTGMSLMFGACFFIYCEFVCNTINLFRNKK
jgi:uncharacterized membrane-anchored protein YitT (DUF2179 family)